uniref:Tick transposon n=1 Tax=Rhipicephalus zambeziensis TaxID=60191 RepID=A0A224Z9J8_9ACAR
MEAIEIEHICEVVVEVPQDHEFIKGLQNRGQRLADALCFPHITQEEGISLLIGSDQLGKILGRDVNWHDDHKGLLSIQTALGWTFQGPLGNDETIHPHTNANVCVLRTNCFMSDELVQKRVGSELRKFWQLESFGITDADEPSSHDKKVLKAFNETIELHDERYKVCLPWKDLPSDLHDNRAVAVKRLRCLLHRLSQSKVVLLKGTLKRF